MGVLVGDPSDQWQTALSSPVYVSLAKILRKGKVLLRKQTFLQKCLFSQQHFCFHVVDLTFFWTLTWPVVH